jgi:tetratricopeptide (TPR) repeat protein
LLPNLLVEGDRLYASKQLAAATAAFRQAFLLSPADPNVLLRLAVALAESDDLCSSAALLRWVARLAPFSVDVHSNSASLQLRQKEPEMAAVSASRAIALDPGRWGAYTNFAVANQSLAVPEQALCYYERSLQLRPSGNDHPRVNIGQLLLSMARLAEGWAQFARRFDVNTPHLATRLPRLVQIDRASRVLLWGDQGVGDQIMFSSMLNDWLARRVASTLRVDDRLVPLFSRSFPTLDVIGESCQFDEAQYDAQLSLGDLGGFLRQTADDFLGCQGVFLSADQDLVRKYGQRLRRSDSRLVVGVSWRSQNVDTGAKRSISPMQLCDSLALPGVTLVNLQYGEREQGDVAELMLDSGVDNTDDLDGLAAVIAACDLVITIGNTTAHLAAALGRETWVLVPKAPGWRWMQRGSRTPWYESVEIFRQTSDNDWCEPLGEIRRRLVQKLENPSHD